MFDNPNYDKTQKDLLKETKEWCRTSVSTYTENKLEEGLLPSLEEFVTKYPEYDHDELIGCIEAEMNRVTNLWVKERTA